MRLLEKVKDGGFDSPVDAYVLIEIKSLFSIMILKFNGTREAFHSHAFNAITLWIKGSVAEFHCNGSIDIYRAGQFKYTPRSIFHKILPQNGKSAWALSFRGPWQDTWQEFKQDHFITLTHGRKEIK